MLLYKVKTTDKHLCHIVVLWPVLSCRGRLASSGFLIKRCQTVLVTKETVTVEKKRRKRKEFREEEEEKIKREKERERERDRGVAGSSLMVGPTTSY